MKKTEKKEGSEMNRLVYGFLAILCLLWVILPDPVPIVVDDILAAAAGALTAAIFFKSKSAT